MATFSIECLKIVGVLTVLCTVFLYYFFYFMFPYRNFPSFRLEHKVLYWIITKKPLNNIFFQYIVKNLKQYEDDGICVCWLFKPYVFIFSEEGTKLLLNNPVAADKPKEYKHLDFCLKDSLFLCNGEKWRKLRMVMSPAFHVSVPQGNINTYNEYSAKLVQQLKIIDPHETTKCLKACCISAFIKSIYGVDTGNPENEYKINLLVKTMEKLGKFAAQRFASPWLYWDFTLHIFPSARRSLKLYNECCSIGMQFLEEANKRFMQSRYQENSINEPKSVAEVLLDYHHQNQSFSLEDVMHQTNASVATNSEGMSTTLMWCLFLLGHHPDIQEKVFEEVVSVTENDVDFSEIRHLTYLECIIKESSRLYTTFPMFGRRLKKDVQVGKYKIPENSTIIFASYILHRNPDIYHDPEKFNPDRFMEPNSKINEWTHVPFAEGIRSCLGKTYAIMALKVILCHVIRNFRVISLDRLEDVVLSWEIVLSSEKNLRLKFVPRKPSEENAA